MKTASQGGRLIDIPDLIDRDRIAGDINDNDMGTGVIGTELGCHSLSFLKISASISPIDILGVLHDGVPVDGRFRLHGLFHHSILQKSFFVRGAFAPHGYLTRRPLRCQWWSALAGCQGANTCAAIDISSQGAAQSARLIGSTQSTGARHHTPQLLRGGRPHSHRGPAVRGHRRPPRRGGTRGLSPGRARAAQGEGSGTAAQGGTRYPPCLLAAGRRPTQATAHKGKGGREPAERTHAANKGPGPDGQDGGDAPPERRGRRAPIGPKPGEQAGQTTPSNTTEATPRPTGCPKGAEAEGHGCGGRTPSQTQTTRRTPQPGTELSHWRPFRSCAKAQPGPSRGRSRANRAGEPGERGPIENTAPRDRPGREQATPRSTAPARGPPPPPRRARACRRKTRPQRYTVVTHLLHGCCLVYRLVY